MRLLILSDLHHEVWRDHAPRVDLAISRPDAVVLAGDIDVAANAVRWADMTFPGLPVLYVHGNHEGYGHNLDAVQRLIERECEATGHVHYLNCHGHRIDDVRFLGATLWTDFGLFGEAMKPIASARSQDAMNDYQRIRLEEKGYRKLRASDTAQWHSSHVRWLEQRLAEPFAGRTVVITHMAPSMRSVPDKYRDDKVSAAYASNLDALAAQADLWVHGHMHTSHDYHIGRCRVVCNPCGYITRGGAPENRNFSPHLVIELDS